MKFELFVAIRYLTSKRKQTVIPVVSAISIAGIAAGVSAMIIALALSTGFKEEIQSKILGATSHINLLHSDGSPIAEYQPIIDKLLRTPGIVAATPGTYDKVFLSAGNRSSGAVLKGIEPRLEREASDLFKQIVAGDATALSDVGGDRRRPAGILLGQELGKTLNLSLGDSVQAYFPKGPLSPMGMTPTIRTFKVIGFFSSGLWDYDLNWGYISLSSAQKLFSMPAGSVGTVEVRVADIYDVEELSDRVRELAGPGFVATNWIDLNRPLFSALKLEKLAIFVTVCLIVMVAAFNIVTTLIMMVMEKNKDIAILSAMGVTARTVVRVFLFEGLMLGLTGTILGCLLGASTSILLDTYRVIRLEPEVYSVPYVPFRVLPTDVVLVAVSAILISFLSTIYPARAASRLNPVEAIRYE